MSLVENEIPKEIQVEIVFDQITKMGFILKELKAFTGLPYSEIKEVIEKNEPVRLKKLFRDKYLKGIVDVDKFLGRLNNDNIIFTLLINGKKDDGVLFKSYLERSRMISKKDVY